MADEEVLYTPYTFTDSVSRISSLCKSLQNARLLYPSIRGANDAPTLFDVALG